MRFLLIHYVYLGVKCVIMSVNTPIMRNFYSIQMSSNKKPGKLSETLNKKSQSEIFKVSALKLSPHPSFIFKQQEISQNLTKLKEQIQLRCATRGIPRQKLISMNDANEIISGRIKKRHSEEYNLNQTNKINFTEFPRKSIAQNIKLANQGKNILIRKDPRYWLKYRKSASEAQPDSYHCSKFLLGVKSTSFYDILEVYYESPTIFPYFNKSTKEYSKNYSDSPVKSRNNSLSNSESQIALNRKLSVKKTYINKIKVQVPSLESKYFNPQNVLFKENVIIINFESITIGNSIIFRPGVVNELMQVSGIFHLVIVSSLHGDESPDIVNKFERLSIKISGFYVVIKKALKNFKFLNYDEVFEDFEVSDPLESCLIISHHLIFECVEDSEYIGSNYGAKIKLNCDKIPAIKKELPSAPAVVLIPSFTTGRSVDLLKNTISNLLIKTLPTPNLPKTNFFTQLKETKNKIISSNIPQQVFKKTLSADLIQRETYSFEHPQYFII